MLGVDPYFELDGDLIVPTTQAAGHWAENSIAGRAMLGLASWAFERELPTAQWLPARLTLDLVHMGTLDPITCTSRVRRSGRTVHVVDLEFTQGERTIALARCLATRAEVAPAGELWSRGESLGAPPHDQLADTSFPMGLATGRAPEFDFRSGVDAWQGSTQGAPACWMKEHATVMAGEELTPYTRLGLLADVGNSVVNWGSAGLQLINPDLTLLITRLPEGDAIGLETIEHLRTLGTAVGAATLFDAEGAFGLVSLTSVHQPVFSGVGG